MAAITDYLLLESGGKILLEDGSGFILLERSHGETGTIIENTTALTRDQSGYTICMRSGARAKPGKLVEDPYTKTMVLAKYVDKPQLTLRERSRSSKLRGSDRPEPTIRFITETINPEDL